MKLRAVQYHPTYCAEAMADMKENGLRPWRWDTSHEVSVIDENGVRHYIGRFSCAQAAHEAGKAIELSGKLPDQKQEQLT
jgi:hypothetical protein